MVENMVAYYSDGTRRTARARAPFTVGSNIRLRGEWYRCVAAEGLSHLGSKSFGRVRWTLQSNAGTRFTVHGNAGSRPAHNSNLYAEKASS